MLKRDIKNCGLCFEGFFLFKSILFTESAIMVRSSVPATLKPHLEEESSIISVTTRMVGRFFYWKMHNHDDDASPVS